MSACILGSPASPPHPARVVTVLIVDDHTVVRHGLRTFLELYGDASPRASIFQPQQTAAASRPASITQA